MIPKKEREVRWPPPSPIPLDRLVVLIDGVFAITLTLLGQLSRFAALILLVFWPFFVTDWWHRQSHLTCLSTPLAS